MKIVTRRKAARAGAGKPRQEGKMRRRHGCTLEGGIYRTLTCVVTGEMADGTKVWTECDGNKEPINIDKQYTLQTRGNWSEFVRL